MEVEVHNSFAGPEDGVLDASAEEAVQELDNIAFDAAEDIDPATTGEPEYDVPPLEKEPEHDVPPVENEPEYDVPPLEDEPGDADVAPPTPTESPPPPPEDLPPPPPADLEPGANPDATETDSPRELADDETMDPDYVNADVTGTDSRDAIDVAVVAGDESGTPPPVYAEDAVTEKEANSNVMANGDTDEIIEMHEHASNGGPKGDVEPILKSSENKSPIKGKSFTICFIMFFFVIALTAVGLAFYFVISSGQGNDTSEGKMITTSSPP